MSQIPGAARKARAVLDWTASLPFPRDISEVGSIGHPGRWARQGAMGSSTSSSPSSSASPPAIIGRGKGSSFWLWFADRHRLPLLGLIAVILYRAEKDEPERRCPTCGKPVKLYVQVCPRCGTELYLPDPARSATPASAEPLYRARCGRSRWRSRRRSGPRRASSSGR